MSLLAPALISLLTAALMLLLRAALPAATLLALAFPVLSFANHAFAILVPVLALAVRAAARLVRRHTLLPALLAALILAALLLRTASRVVPTRFPLRLIAFVRHGWFSISDYAIDALLLFGLYNASGAFSTSLANL